MRIWQIVDTGNSDLVFRNVGKSSENLRESCFIKKSVTVSYLLFWGLSGLTQSAFLGLLIKRWRRTDVHINTGRAWQGMSRRRPATINAFKYLKWIHSLYKVVHAHGSCISSLSGEDFSISVCAIAKSSNRQLGYQGYQGYPGGDFFSSFQVM